ncbi:MAG: 50S ribosomal protein L35 [Dehalococcoidales bacterium]|nr:50S ribosomal protein L35 [Dehalococcoidales bacterium]
MPKLKTHKSAETRFRVTGSGKIIRHHVGKSHLRRAKAKRVKRQYYEMTALKPADHERIRRLIPYGIK